MARAGELALADLPADGEQRTLLTAERFGRYAVWVTSEQGASVRVDDRMAGPGDERGLPGAADGRVDAFLEAGEHRVVAEGVASGQGALHLDAQRAVERNSRLELLDGNVQRAELRDHEQRTVWVKVEADGRVEIEAVGRYVADLRLWRDGDWLEALSPRCSTYEPVEGQPWGRCVLEGKVEPGWVKAVVYGGAGAKWAEEATTADLVLRRGYSSAPVMGTTTGTLGAEGFARFRVPANLYVVRLELPEVAPARLTIARRGAVDSSARSGAITRETRTPEVSVTASGIAEQLVTVWGAPGQRYKLVTYAQSDALTSTLGSVNVTSVPRSRHADNLEPTGVLWERLTDGKAQVIAAQALDLGGATFTRRFNLLDPATLLVRADEVGSWSFALTEGEGTLTLEPFLIERPRDYVAPEPVAGSLTQELNPGLYVLTLRPKVPGATTLQIAPSGYVASARRAIFGSGEAPPLRPGLRFDGVSVNNRTSLTSFGPRGDATLVVRPSGVSGLDLVLPIVAGERLYAVVQFPEDGLLEARLDGGDALPIGLDDGALAERQWVKAGSHRLTVRGPATGTGFATLKLVRPNDAEGTPPRPLSGEPPDAVRPVAVLRGGGALAIDLERGGKRAVELDVPKAGLYRLETTGLLATSLALRSRTRLNIAADNGSGAGRNAALDLYLREGRYRVDVGARGRSAGHLSLSLKEAPLADAGALNDGVTARISLAAGQGAVLHLNEPAAGRIDLTALSLGATVRCRVEDDDGWAVRRAGPVADPCTQRWELHAGGHRVLLLPSDVPVRRVVRAEVVRPPEPVAPGPLAFGASVAGWWTEPVAGEERAPQVWRFTLAAPAVVTVDVGGAVVGRLLGPKGEALGVALDGMPLTTALDAGAYTVAVAGERRDNGVAYTLSAETEALVAGSSKLVWAPGSLPVSLAGGTVALQSFGDVDVRLALRDASGVVVAANDDRPDDWNALIVGDFPAGNYRLDVLADGEGAHTQVALVALPDRRGAPLAPGQRRDLDLADGAVVVLPLEGLSDDSVVTLAARSEENLGLILEHQVGERWVAVGEARGRAPELALRPGDGAYRLRAWSLDQRGLPAHVVARASRPSASSQRVAVDASAARVRTTGPGLWTISAPSEGLWWCPAPGACREARPGTFPVPDDGLWFAGAGRASVRPAELEHAVVIDWRGSERGVAQLPAGDGATLVWTRADAGVVGVGFGARGAFDASAGASAAVDLSGAATSAELWTASPGATRVDLQAVRVAEGQALTASPGSSSAVVPARTLRRVVGFARDEEVRVLLPAGVVAWVKGARGVEVIAAVNTPRVERLAWPVGELVLLNPGETDALVAVERWRGGPPSYGLGRSAPTRLRFDQAGVERIVVSGEPEDRVSAAGAVTGLWLLHPDGTVDLGPDLAVGAGGVLVVEHGVGDAVLALDAPADTSAAVATVVSGGQAVPLSLPSHLLQVKQPHGVLARVAVGEPFIAEVRVGDGVPRRELHRDGVVLAWLPNGVGSFALSALGGGSLRSVARVELIEPTLASSGLGEPLLLPPGGARAFRVEVPRELDLGLGVAASSDVVRGELFGPDGASLGQGLVQHQHLAPGAYVFALSAPVDGPPLSARPSVVGLDVPSDGPPANVVQTYVQETRR